MTTQDKNNWEERFDKQFDPNGWDTGYSVPDPNNIKAFISKVRQEAIEGVINDMYSWVGNQEIRIIEGSQHEYIDICKVQKKCFQLKQRCLGKKI